MLQELRKKPKYVRDQYAFFGAGIICAVITVIWLVSLPVRLEQATTAASDSQEEVSGAFANFMSDAKNQVGDVLEHLQETDSATTVDEVPAVDPQPETEPLFDLADFAASTAPAVNEKTIIIATTSVDSF